MISANEHQPPLVLPRWGDAGYYVTVKDWLTKVTLVTVKDWLTKATLVTDKPLIISWL